MQITANFLRTQNKIPEIVQQIVKKKKNENPQEIHGFSQILGCEMTVLFPFLRGAE